MSSENEEFTKIAMAFRKALTECEPPTEEDLSKLRGEIYKKDFRREMLNTVLNAVTIFSVFGLILPIGGVALANAWLPTAGISQEKMQFMMMGVSWVACAVGVVCAIIGWRAIRARIQSDEVPMSLAREYLLPVHQRHKAVNIESLTRAVQGSDVAKMYIKALDRPLIVGEARSIILEHQDDEIRKAQEELRREYNEQLKTIMRISGAEGGMT